VSPAPDILPLLRESLVAWRLAGTVECGSDVAAGPARLRIRPAPPELPFRWIIAGQGRERGATGIPGLLRQVRAALDPDHAAVRLRLAARPTA
jgi:hypothetical protein